MAKAKVKKQAKAKVLRQAAKKKARVVHAMKKHAGAKARPAKKLLHAKQPAAAHKTAPAKKEHPAKKDLHGKKDLLAKKELGKAGKGAAAKPGDEKGQKIPPKSAKQARELLEA